LLLNRLGLSQTEKRLWVRSIQRDLGTKPLPAGKEVHFYLSRPAGSNGARSAVQLKAVEVDYNESLNLTWEKGSWGIVFDKREKPYDIELKTVGAVVDNALFEDAKKAGIQPPLISQLADIFSWDIDFHNNIRQGDSFKILYESRSRKGQETKTTLRILAAELINAGEKLTAIYFEKQQGVGGYFNLDGRSLARAFLRFPLEFTTITSHFTEARFHPVLKVNVPHTGVDFAAPRGTPIRAVGDGVITYAGWNGGYGKSIDIQHDATYSTRYAHLGRFATGIRGGASVKKGHVIGYVGSTGRATGPHLHFEFYKDQQYVNPLSADFPAEDEIEPALQRLFDNQKSLLLVELTSSPQS
jgi:murein DD-endopeptidase MepM/ murein hydrolase activator NlpD